MWIAYVREIIKFKLFVRSLVVFNSISSLNTGFDKKVLLGVIKFPKMRRPSAVVAQLLATYVYRNFRHSGSSMNNIFTIWGTLIFMNSYSLNRNNRKSIFFSIEINAFLSYWRDFRNFSIDVQELSRGLSFFDGANKPKEGSRKLIQRIAGKNNGDQFA